MTKTVVACFFGHHIELLLASSIIKLNISSSPFHQEYKLVSELMRKHPQSMQEE